MSYTVTCYCNDETIYETSVYIPSARPTPYTGTYGSSALGDYEEFTIASLDSGWSARFTATADTDCSFYRWVYRVGSSNATVQYSYDNPFVYTGGEDIYIGAEGIDESGGGSGGDGPGAEPDEWNGYTASLSTVTTTEQSDTVTLGYYEVYRYRVKFSTSGYAHFYTTGNIDTFGYLSDSGTWNSNYSGPKTYLASDDDSGNGSNFDIGYNVTAGTIYYVFIRGLSGKETGNVTLGVTPPETETTIEKWSWSTSNGSATDSQTYAAYTAVKNKGAVKNFSYLVWNDMVDKVTEILDATDAVWDSRVYPTAANTKMTSSDKTLTAERFNALRYNIGSHYSTGISDVSTGDDVLGSYFITLASCINSWIDTL